MIPRATLLVMVAWSPLTHARSTLLTFQRGKPYVSVEAAKHLQNLQVPDARVRNLAYQAAEIVAQNFWTKPTLPVLTSDSTHITVIANLDMGLGPVYETTIGTQALNAASEAAVTSLGSSMRKLVRTSTILPRGSASVSWRGHRKLLPFVQTAFENHPSVMQLHYELPLRTTTVGLAPYAFERAGWAGPDVHGLNPNLNNVANNTWAAYGYAGAGQVVAVGDTGLWTGHARYQNLRAKYGAQAVRHQTCDVSGASDTGATCACLSGSAGTHVNYISYSCNTATWCDNFVTDHHAQAFDHGTHVAGLVLKSAPDARLVKMDLQSTAQHSAASIVPPPDMYDQLLAMPYSCHGARIFSFSWAASNQGVYTQMDKVMDHFAWDYADALIVVAAGNEGQDGARSVGSPSTAKNVLSVGAVLATRNFFTAAASDSPYYTHFWKGSDSVRVESPSITGTVGTVYDVGREWSGAAREVMTWSSRGPSADGRRKPDVAAVGSYAVSDHATGQLHTTLGSLMDQDGSNSMQGTSMATPVLAGAIAVIADVLDSCSTMYGCVLNLSTVGNMAANGGYGALTRTGTPASSLLRAFVGAAAQPAVAQASYVSVWRNGHYVRRPYRSTDPQSLAQAQAASGLGEVTLGRALLPTPQQPLLHTYAYGETSQRQFLPLSASQAMSTQGLDTTLATVMWAGDTNHNARCYRALADNVRVTAVLAWRDYPSQPNCNPCLETDLALSMHSLQTSVGGATADTMNNLEMQQLTLANTGDIVKVFVFATRVFYALTAQRYSLVVTGNVQRVTDSASCNACSLGNERVPCVSSAGYGDNQCGSNQSQTNSCQRYAACYAVADSGKTLTGVLASQCSSQKDCLAIMFPSSDQARCVTYDCTSTTQKRIVHGSGTHTCPYGYSHRCVNYTNPDTLQTRQVVSASCIQVAQQVNTNVDDTSFLTTLKIASSIASGVLLIVMFVWCTANSVRSFKK